MLFVHTQVDLLLLKLMDDVAAGSEDAPRRDECQINRQLQLAELGNGTPTTTANVSLRFIVVIN